MVQNGPYARCHKNLKKEKKNKHYLLQNNIKLYGLIEGIKVTVTGNSHVLFIANILKSQRDDVCFPYYQFIAISS